MMASRKTWEDDDGRTIASMQNVERPNLLFPRRIKRYPESEYQEQENTQETNQPWKQDDPLSHSERRWAVLGALKASLMIGLAFIAGLGAVILLMLWLWN